MARQTRHEGQDQHEGQHEGQEGQEGQQNEGQEGQQNTASIDDLDAVFVLAAPLATVAAPKNKRNEQQEKMDKKVLEIHERWVKAGKPSVWGKQVETGCVVTYFLLPEAVAARVKLVNKAADFHGNLRAKWGTAFDVTEEIRADMARRGVNLPEEYVGRKAVSFTIVDKITRKPATSATSAAQPGTGEGASA